MNEIQSYQKAWALLGEESVRGDRIREVATAEANHITGFGNPIQDGVGQLARHLVVQGDVEDWQDARRIAASALVLVTRFLAKQLDEFDRRAMGPHVVTMTNSPADAWRDSAEEIRRLGTFEAGRGPTFISRSAIGKATQSRAIALLEAPSTEMTAQQSQHGDEFIANAVQWARLAWAEGRALPSGMQELDYTVQDIAFVVGNDNRERGYEIPSGLRSDQRFDFQRAVAVDVLEAYVESRVAAGTVSELRAEASWFLIDGLRDQTLDALRSSTPILDGTSGVHR